MLARSLLFLFVVVAFGGGSVVVSGCEDGGEGEGEGGEGEGEVDPDAPLDADQVRLGSALVDDEGAPVVEAGALPTPPDGVDVFDLGNLAVGASGETGTVLIDVDARVKSVTFVVYGEEHVVLARAEDGGGVVVVDDAVVPPETPGFAQVNALSSGFPAQFLSPGRVLPAKPAGAFALPSSPDVAFSDGTWSVRFGHFAVGVDDGGDPLAAPHPTPLRVLALVRTAPVVPGSIKLALHFTGALGLTAAQAEVSTSFAQALSVLQDSWGAVGVDASDVVFIDMDDGAEFGTVVLDEPRCDGGDLDELVQKGLPDRLNLFFIERFECGPFGPFLLGMSPGIPGIPYAAKTTRSGVVIASAFLASQPTEFSIVLAHESAHFLGLYHTQENDRFDDADVYDNVDDTGESPASRQNLMFFDVSRISDITLSPGQGKQMQRNPQVLP